MWGVFTETGYSARNGFMVALAVSLVSDMIKV